MPDVVMPQPEQMLHGFKITRVRDLPAFRATLVEAEHEQSGAHLLHIYAPQDTENAFTINFPTPPPDDTGLPHILEHAVLAGSKRFPVKEPFFEMIKMSMATFINALTGYDMTYYPVASNVRADLFNLADVYFDAVFHPLLTEETFRREGHHLAPANADEPTGPLKVTGIVFNEMKGAFSSPEQILGRTCANAIAPDTPYGKESGGDPLVIPDLTYEQFKAFHAKYYHPSNALFVFYGNIPTADYFAFLEERLASFKAIAPPEPINIQPRWDAPREMQLGFPVGDDEPVDDRSFLVMNWLVGSGADVEDVLAWEVLDLILTGDDAAPLKKALIDSKLGQDIVMTGFAPLGLETTFRVGIRGTEADKKAAFESLVLDTLKQIADKPIAAKRVESALRRASLDTLEVKEMFPLHTAFHVLSVWPYGVDPIEGLRLGEHIEALRERYDADPDLFNKLIRERLLGNPHRLTVTLVPDRNAQSEMDGKFAERLKKVEASLDDAAKQRIAEDAAALEASSGEPNPPEALAKLPQLKLSDLPAKPRHIPTTVTDLGGGMTLLRNDVFANGVSYLAVDINLAGLGAGLYAYLPRYCDAFDKLGAAGQDFQAIAERRAAHTGSLSCSAGFTGHTTDPGKSRRSLRYSMKALDDQLDPALDLLRDLLFEVDASDQARLADVVTQARARYRASMPGDGAPLTARRQAARTFSAHAALDHLVHGLPQLRLTDELKADFDGEVHALIADIARVRDFLHSRSRITISFTGSDEAYDTLLAKLDSWSSLLRSGEDVPADGKPMEPSPMPRDGLAAPIQVAHCHQLIAAPHTSDERAPLLQLGASLLSRGHLLQEIRLKGNAYGASCAYVGNEKRIQMFSYRDPHIERTLGVFDGLTDVIRQTTWSAEEIERTIISGAKEAETPIRPGTATGQALSRYLLGQTEEWRDKWYAGLLAAKPDTVKAALLSVFEESASNPAICVLAGREKLEKANEKLGDKQLAIETILS